MFDYVLEAKSATLNAASIFIDKESGTLTFSRIWGDELASSQDYENGYDLTLTTVYQALIDDQDKFVRLSEGIFQIGEDATLMDSVELV